MDFDEWRLKMATRIETATRGPQKPRKEWKRIYAELRGSGYSRKKARSIMDTDELFKKLKPQRRK